MSVACRVSSHLSVAFERCEVTSETRHKVKATSTELALLQRRAAKSEEDHQAAIRAYGKVWFVHRPRSSAHRGDVRLFRLPTAASCVCSALMCVGQTDPLCGRVDWHIG